MSLKMISIKNLNSGLGDVVPVQSVVEHMLSTMRPWI